MKKFPFFIISCLALVALIVGGLFWYRQQKSIEDSIHRISDKTWTLVSHGELDNEQPVLDGTLVSLTFDDEKMNQGNGFYPIKTKLFGNIYSYKYKFFDSDNVLIELNIRHPIAIRTKEPSLSEQALVSEEIEDKHQTIITDSKLQLINQDNYSLIFEVQE